MSRQAPYKHYDGSNCWTKNCKRNRRATGALVSDEIKAELERRKAEIIKTEETTQDVRKLVSIRSIDKISPIDGADAIESAYIGGWAVVVRKDQFSAGDKVVYFEIDTLLPNDQPIFEDFQRHGQRTMEMEDGSTVVGYAIKTIKLRGQISQGLILPISSFPELNEESSQEEVNKVLLGKYGVVKYEAPIPASLSGTVRGYFPTKYVQKTDSERVQNLSDEFLQSSKVKNLTWVATEKIDGTSATFIKDGDELRVCSRNMELIYDPNDNENVYNRIATELKLADSLPDGAIIQGEIYGEGIQKNPLRIRGVKLAVFNTKNLDNSAEISSKINSLKVPVMTEIQFPKTVDEAITQADGLKSTLNPNAHMEGIVWWNREGVEFSETGGRANFKAINNQFLLKSKD